jgi:four helix bundle protein
MRDFQRLRLIRFVRELIVLTYRTTDQFPRSEQFGLTSQMRRAAVAIGSNIAEGCGRSSNRAYRVSLDRAMGEGSELEFQCLVAQDLGLGSPSAVDHLLKETIRVKKMLARLIVFIRGQQTPSDEGRTPPRAREPERPPSDLNPYPAHPLPL